MLFKNFWNGESLFLCQKKNGIILDYIFKKLKKINRFEDYVNIYPYFDIFTNPIVILQRFKPACVRRVEYVANTLA